MTHIKPINALAIVAHPDDETLWVGGTILCCSMYNWTIISLCRASDKERSTKFYKAIKIFGAKGYMGDLDDGPEQSPLVETDIEETILKLLPEKDFDTVFTHSPAGEYTRHLRHEETGNAVIKLWKEDRISTNKLWTFAYHDSKKEHLPKAIDTADFYHLLPEQIWKKKYKIVTEIYGFEKDSWEAKTTPTSEAFWKIDKFKYDE